MADPLSVAGSAVGIISLGISVIQGLFDYYAAFQNQKTDVAHTTKKLSRRLELLEGLRQQLQQHESNDDDCKIFENINLCIEDCKELIRQLQVELVKLHKTPHQGDIAILHATGRRIAYPFRRSTLQKLDKDIDDFVSCLSLAAQILQQRDISKVQDDIADTKALLDLAKATQVSLNTREWLKAPDASIGFNEVAKKKHPGTGLWFVKGLPFTIWLEKPSSFLWIVGFAGCGKSVLCSTAIKFAFRHRRANPRIGIAFFFFTFNDESKQDVSAMLRSLVLQLSGQLDDNHTFLSHLQDDYHNASPPDSALMDCLRQLVRAFKDVYIILDALDESPKDKCRDATLQCLVELRAWHEPSLHLIVSSRDEVDIREELEALPEEIVKMKNDSIDRDIASFISEHLRNNRRLRKWEEHHAHIESILTTKAQGVFRWVECQFKALANCPQSEDLLEQLLESLPQTLDETYERMLSNIPSTSRDYAQQMLKLLCCARRPLTVAELIDGIAVQLDDPPRFNPKRKLKNVDAIQEVCPGLTELDVNADTTITTVRIAHFSVREYLESGRIRDPANAAFNVNQQHGDAQMACICLTVLLEPRPVISNSTSLQHDNLALTYYAAQHWPDHFLSGIKDRLATTQALRLFKNEKGLFENWVAVYNIDDSNGKLLRAEIPSPLYYASRLGLDSIVSVLLKDANYATLSSIEGNETTAKLLLGKGIDINARCGHYGNALQAAAYGGHDKVVQLLLEKDASVDAEGGCYGNALQAAAYQGHDKTVQLLLEKDASVDAEGGCYGNALQAAAYEGHDKTVQLLLDHGASVNAGYGQFKSALQAAARAGHDKVVQLLLDRGAHVNAGVGDYGRHDGIVQWVATPPQGVYFEVCHAIRQMVLDFAFDYDTDGRLCGTALQAASGMGHYKTVELLLDRGADVNAKSGRYGTPLQAAAYIGSNEAVQLLLDRGANINAEGGHYGNALQAASAGGHDMIIRLLLKKGAKIAQTGQNFPSKPRSDGG